MASVRPRLTLSSTCHPLTTPYHLGSFASHEHMPVDLMDVNLVKSFLSLAEGTQGDLGTLCASISAIVVMADLCVARGAPRMHVRAGERGVSFGQP